MNVTIRIVCLGLVLQACGDDGSGTTDGGVDDAVDAANDAPMTAFECPKSGTTPVCGATMAPTVPAPAGGTTVCNPLAQTGCNAGEKCTWLLDQASPPIGHIGCTPDGTVAIGCACTIGTPGTTGYDDCIKGSTCLGGVCKQICDEQGGAPTCATGFACTGYQDVFEVGGTRVAGVCDVTCDPLTQCTSVSQTPNACGATDATMPNRGCYGYDSYSCAPASAGTLALTDRMTPRTNSSGNPYLNGCAPGFIPFFYEMTGSTRTLCTGYCAALEVDNTPAHVGNSKGNPAAYAKLPTAAAPFLGDGTCEIGKKGSHISSMCKFIWPYVVDNSTGELPPAFANGPHLDTLGVCQAIAFFQYDSNNDGTPDMPFPDCSTLPPHTPGDMNPGNDASDFGCQKKSNSESLATPGSMNPALRDIHVGLRESIPMYRHTFD